MKILVLAAGKGSRLQPYTEKYNKCMIPLMGKPLLYFNLQQCVSVLPDCSEIIIVVGYLREQITEYFGDSFFEIPIRYIQQENLDGIAGAVALAAKEIKNEPFLLTLGDGLLFEADLVGMAEEFRKTGVDGMCGVLHGRPYEEIQQNYTLALDNDGFITQLIEKPVKPFNDLMGSGYCFFKASTLSCADMTPISSERNQRELCDWINLCIQNGFRFRTYLVGRELVNLNNYSDLKQLERIMELMGGDRHEES